MPLHPDPARPLTSREIAKSISGLLGVYTGWCDPDEIIAALDHLVEHRDSYADVVRRMAMIHGSIQAATVEVSVADIPAGEA